MSTENRVGLKYRRKLKKYQKIVDQISVTQVAGSAQLFSFLFVFFHFIYLFYLFIHFVYCVFSFFEEG